MRRVSRSSIGGALFAAVNKKTRCCFRQRRNLIRRYGSMTLEDLLGYKDIVIQCHDDPDADAITPE